MKAATISKVNKFKMLCALTFFTISLIIVFLVSINNNRSKIVLNTIKSDKYNHNIEVYNPILYGIDSKSRPYNLVARKAKQLNPNLIELTDLSAEFVDQNSKWFAATAESGKFENNKEKLGLLGDVHIFTNNANEMKSKNVIISFHDGSASSEEHVEMLSPSGVLLANGFNAKNQGRNIKFTGPIKMTIYPYSQKK